MGFIHPHTWSADGKQFWATVTDMAILKNYFVIDRATREIRSFSAPKENPRGGAINPYTNELAFVGYGEPPYPGGLSLMHEKPPQATGVFIHNFESNTTRRLPVPIDDSTVIHGLAWVTAETLALHGFSKDGERSKRTVLVQP